MRGTVLLVDDHESRHVYADGFRASGLFVIEAAHPEKALTLADATAPDVVVTVLVSAIGPSVVRELRRRVDHATSIIATSTVEHRQAARDAGADSFLLRSASPSEVLYEIHRALLLRRSGRRLPWKWGSGSIR